MKPRLYVETTIPSYLVARRSRDLRLAADQETTQEWWETCRERFALFISQAVIREVSLATRRSLPPGWSGCAACRCCH
jgi:hypothetical protein